jgi:hypothetical protein
MEPTPEPDNNRQSRGLARFWPVHGMPAPAQRQSEEDLDAPDGASSAHASDQLAGVAGPTGEHPQVSDQQSQPQDDQQAPDEPVQGPFAPARPHPALTSETQMVALGSRRPADALLGGNGARWSNQGGFPPVETNGHRNGDLGPRHGGAPIANGQPPASNGSLPGSRSPFAPSSDGGPAASPFAPSPFSQQAHGSAAVNGGNAEPPAQAPHPLAPAAPPYSLAPAPPHPLAPAAPHMQAPQDPPAAVPVPEAVTPEQLEPPAARAVSGPPAAGSAQVQNPMTGHPVSAQPVSGQPAAEQPQGARPVPHTLHVDPATPTRLEPTGWATPSPRAAASGSAAVPVSAPNGGVPHGGEPNGGEPSDGMSSGRVSNGGMTISGVPNGAVTGGGVTGGGRRSRDDEAADGHRTPAQRRSTSLDDARETPGGRRAARAAEPDAVDAPLRPGDVHESPITFWDEAAIEQFRAEWHEVKAQFVDDPVAALTRAHDLLTEAVHELTESMLAERDELDPLRGTATPDTESMRMAMRGYREFLDRILTL